MSRLRANQITNKTANGAPTATNGFIVTGVCTATSFVGSGTALTGIDAATLKFGNSTKAEANNSGVVVTGILTVTGNMGVGGVLTYEDVTNVDSIGIVTARSGIKIGPSAGVAGTFFADGSYVTAGIITAGSYRGDGSQLTGISVGITTQAITPSGITTHLLLSSADDHKV